MKHTILGAGGSIGNALTYELLQAKETVRLVSRSKYSIPGTEVVGADLKSYDQTLESIKGTDVVYLCVGLPYDAKIWSVLWPRIMQNTIDACKEHGAKLIFVDNVYMYGSVAGKMTEETPYNPCSKKGEIRAKVARMLEDEIKSKNLDAIIARSADFYGPFGDKNSITYVLALAKMLQGKTPQWLVDTNTPHSYTNISDIGKALRLLAHRDDAFNQVWHLPTHNPGITGKEFIKIAATELGIKPNYQVLRKWMLKMAGLFDKNIGEIYEMLNQSDSDYYFDSTKFNDTFDYTPKTYEEGIKETITFFKTQS